jgi:hypothetical protein
LLLAELVGLVVLERHQLFEPVHETVGNLQDNMGRVLDSLGSITEKLNSSGQVTTYICVCSARPAAARGASA